MDGVWNLSYPKWLKLLVLLSVFSRLYNNLHGIPQDVQAFYFELGKIRGPGLLRFEGGKLMYQKIRNVNTNLYPTWDVSYWT